jgi:hypothetical protein
MEPEVDHERGQFDRVLKVETVKLIQERGVTMVAQASHDLGVHGAAWRQLVQECAADSH